MAITNPINVDTSIPEIWAKSVLRDHRVRGFWQRFVGPEGSGSPIIQKFELLGGPGDLIHLQVTNPLSGSGVVGDTATLEGNEESLSTTEIKLATLLYRHAVKTNRRANKKSIVDLRMEAKMRLAEWGMNAMDSIRWTALTASTAATGLPTALSAETYTPNYYSVGGSSTGVNDIGAGDTLTVAAIQQIKLKLRLQRAKPVMVDGFPHYILVTHPYSTYDLKRETEYMNWVREAQVRGDSNPFFRGALAVIDGVIIYEHESTPIVTNTGPQSVSKGIAFGAEFACEALDERVDWEEDTFDYGKDWGVGYSFAFYPRRALELSSCQVYAEAGNPVA